MKTTDLSLKKCEELYDELKLYFKPFGIEEKINYVKRYFLTKDNIKKFGPSSKLLPISLMLYNAENDLSKIRLKQTDKISESLYGIAILTESIRMLKEHHIGNLEEKLKDLSSDDRLKFEKILYEIEMGNELIKMGLKFNFIKEKIDELTHDIELEDGIRIDCKKRDSNSPIQQKTKNLFGQLVNQIESQIAKFDSNYFIYFTINERLSEEVVKKYVGRLKEIILSDKEGTFSYGDDSVRVQKINYSQNLRSDPTSMTQKIIQNEFGYDTWRRIIIENDYYDVLTTPTGTWHFYGLKSTFLGTRFDGIETPLKKGKKQVSWDGPSIIFLDIDYDPEMVVYDFEKCSEIIERFLQNNSSVSAIVLTTQVKLNWSGVITYFYDGKVILNKNAKYTLNSFIIFDDIDNHVFESRKVQYDEDSEIQYIQDPKEASASVFDLVCVGCKNKITLQANHVKGLPLSPNHYLFPVSKKFVCPHCKFETDLSDSYKTIIENTGKEIF